MPKGRKRSADPKQEALRNAKDQWNDAASKFISTLIHLKRGINGRGSAELNIPPSKITEPLPSEIGSVLSTLSSDFQALVSSAGQIVSEQAGYSQNRRKPQDKKPKAPIQLAPRPTPTTEPAVNPIEQALNPLASIKQHLMEKYASSRSSRGWEYLKSIFDWREPTRDRINLLKATADLYYNFLDFENDVLTIGVESIEHALHSFEVINNNFRALIRAVKLLEQAAPTKEVSREEQSEISPPAMAPPNEEEQKLISDIERDRTQIVQTLITLDRLSKQLNKSEILPPDIAAQFKEDIIYLDKEVDLDHKKQLLQGMRKSLQNFIRQLEETLPAENWLKVYQSTQPFMRTAETGTELQLVKLAHNLVSRFLRRQLLKSLKFDKTAKHRLKIVEYINRCKEDLQKMMSLLEDRIDLSTLAEKMQSISKSLDEIKSNLQILSIMYREHFYNKERELTHNKSISDDQLMDRVLKRRMRRDLADELG